MKNLLCTWPCSIMRCSMFTKLEEKVLEYNGLDHKMLFMSLLRSVVHFHYVSFLLLHFNGID